jgi:hypothetical protein
MRSLLLCLDPILPAAEPAYGGGEFPENQHDSEANSAGRFGGSRQSRSLPLLLPTGPAYDYLPRAEVDWNMPQIACPRVSG